MSAGPSARWIVDTVLANIRMRQRHPPTPEQLIHAGISDAIARGVTFDKFTKKGRAAFLRRHAKPRQAPRARRAG